MRELSTWTHQQTERFAGVWGRATDDETTAFRYGLDVDELRHLSDQYAADGLQLAAVSGLSHEAGERFAAVWRAATDDDRRVVRYGLDDDELRHAIEKHAAEGFQLAKVSGWSHDDRERFAGVWQQESDESRVVRFGLDDDELRGAIEQLASDGLELSAISGWSHGERERFAGVWQRSIGETKVVSYALEEDELAHAIEQHAADGLQLDAICGWSHREREKFAGVWRRPTGGDDETVVQYGLDKQKLERMNGILTTVLLAQKQIPGTIFSSPDEFRLEGDVLEFFTDNPEIVVPIDLAYQSVKWSAEDVPQELESAGDSWVMTNGKLGMYTWIDANLSPKGAIEADGELQPTSSGDRAAPSQVEVSLERVALGFETLRVRAWTQGPRYNPINSYELKARLNKEVLLVPVEVAYFYPDSEDGLATQEHRARAIFDGQSTHGSLVNSTWEGEIRVSAREWSLRAPSILGDSQSGLEVPDSIFRQANIAFRLRAYDQFPVERKQTQPRPGDYLDDRSAYRINRNLFSDLVSDQNRAPALRIILMGRVAPDESLIDGISGVGSGFAGVGVKDFATSVLSHEICHAAGRDHVQDPKNLMYDHPSAVALTGLQIQQLRDWAKKFQSQWQ